MSTRFSAVTPEGVVGESDAASVTLPTADGEITVLPNHIPLVSVLRPGVITVRESADTEHHVAASGGFVQVSAREVNVLADTAERADNIDTERAEAARRKAEEAMSGQLADVEMAEVSASLQRNLARLRAAELLQHRRSRGKGSP